MNPEESALTSLHSGMLNVSVVLATPDRQQLVTVSLSHGSSAWDAVLVAVNAGLDVQKLSGGKLDENTTIGVYGRVVEKSHRLEQGDRVEIYRPLILDPMEQRRRRARGGQ